VHREGVDGCFVAVEFERGSQCALLARLCGIDVVPETKCAVGAG